MHSTPLQDSKCCGTFTSCVVLTTTVLQILGGVIHAGGGGGQTQKWDFRPRTTSTPRNSPQHSEAEEDVPAAAAAKAASCLPSEVRPPSTQIVVHTDRAVRKVRPAAGVADLGLRPELALFLGSAGIREPSLVQSALWPAVNR